MKGILLYKKKLNLNPEKYEIYFCPPSVKKDIKLRFFLLYEIFQFTVCSILWRNAVKIQRNSMAFH